VPGLPETRQADPVDPVFFFSFSLTPRECRGFFGRLLCAFSLEEGVLQRTLDLHAEREEGATFPAAELPFALFLPANSFSNELFLLFSCFLSRPFPHTLVFFQPSYSLPVISFQSVLFSYGLASSTSFPISPPSCRGFSPPGLN